ncbi:MAG: DUF5688 family protein [Lachnospiraceae bacterium]|nr:DUF5688 family protein [Lachnospiraceae bacterium]
MKELLFVKFREKLEEALNEIIPEHAKVHFHETGKNNGVIYQAVTIMEEGSMISPDIHLEEAFREYSEGREIEEIAEEILSLWKEHNHDTGFDVDDFSDYEKAKMRLRFRIINYEENAERLARMPHIPFLDLAVVFFYHLESMGENVQGSVQVENNHLELWGIDKAELMDTAIKNTLETMDASCVGICKVLSDLMGQNICEEAFGEVAEPNMFVLSNRENYFGAAVLYNTKLLQKVSEKMNGDFIVLPSSVHEVIVMPSGDWTDYEELNSIISQINEEQVAREEVLSDHLYYYDAGMGELKIPC